MSLALASFFTPSVAYGSLIEASCLLLLEKYRLGPAKEGERGGACQLLLWVECDCVVDERWYSGLWLPLALLLAVNSVATLLATADAMPAPLEATRTSTMTGVGTEDCAA